MAVGGTNGAVELWNVETRQRKVTYQVPGGKVRALKFSPKDTLFLANCGSVVDRKWKGTVTVLNLTTGQPQGRFEDSELSAWAFSPDETLLATPLDDYCITVRHLATQKTLAHLKAHTWKISALAFSPNGKHFLSASIDNTVRLWDTTSWKELDLLRGHMGGVTAAAVSFDGKFLATGSIDDALKLWDLSSIPAQELLSLRTAPHQPESVLLSPDSSVLPLNATSENTGLRVVLLLRAPSFAEIDAREKAKRQERTTVSGNN
ncbi:MAG: hypothetical protein EXS36_10335 [Pedosphaera sp.]|nr:hypothetical protein [Pedosphaera sp.]